MRDSLSTAASAAVLALLSTAAGADCPRCPAGARPMSGADWRVCWSEGASGEGLVIENACFRGDLVLARATQPFVIVPYQGEITVFKDGLIGDSACGGAPYSPIPGAFRRGSQPDDDNPPFRSFGLGRGPSYRQLVVARTYSLGWYAYRQRWVFKGTGEIEASLGLGGFLAPGDEGLGHFHSAYWRLDFDLDDPDVNFVERFDDGNLLSGDGWVPVPVEARLVGSGYEKWRVRSSVTNRQGEFRSYEIRTSLGRTYKYGTGDFWALRDHAGEGGEIVGSDGAVCNDKELETVYGTPAESLDGQDVVVWVAAHEFHEPREAGEEGPRMPGFHYVGVHLTPRGFTDATP